VDSQIQSTRQSRSKTSSSAFQPQPTSCLTNQNQLEGVRDGVMLMKNELTALKKDLSYARRGLETNKKPLMVCMNHMICNIYELYNPCHAIIQDIINRLDASNKLPRGDSKPSQNGGSHISSVKEVVVDTQQALEELKRTMTTFGNKV